VQSDYRPSTFGSFNQLDTLRDVFEEETADEGFYNGFMGGAAVFFSLYDFRGFSMTLPGRYMTQSEVRLRDILRDPQHGNESSSSCRTSRWLDFLVRRLRTGVHRTVFRNSWRHGLWNVTSKSNSFVSWSAGRRCEVFSRPMRRGGSTCNSVGSWSLIFLGIPARLEQRWGAFIATDNGMIQSLF
jgi:hypothetical protein